MKKLGILCYKLMPATVSCLSRLAEKATDWVIDVYPLFHTSESDSQYVDVKFNVCSVTRSPALGGFVDAGNIAVEKMPKNLCLSTVLKLIVKSDVIMLFGIQALPAVVASMLSRALRKPTIVVTQTVPYLVERERHWLIRGLKGIAIRNASVYIAQTKVTVETLNKSYGVDTSGIVFAPFEAGLSLFSGLVSSLADEREAIRREYHIESAEVVFMSCGSLLQLKGFDVLLDAFGRLTVSHPQARLLVAGTTPAGASNDYEQQLRSLAKSLPNPGAVQFVGQLSPDELAKLYTASDVFVLSTRKDTFGKVLAEAALAGLPLVTTDRCGTAGDLVQDRYNGYVVKTNNVEMLEQKMKLLLDKETRAIFGTRSKELVKTYSSPQKELEGFIETLRRVDNKRRIVERHTSVNQK